MAQSDRRVDLATSAPFSPYHAQVVGMPKVSSAVASLSGAKTRQHMGDTDIGGFIEILRRNSRKILAAMVISLASVSLSCICKADLHRVGVAIRRSQKSQSRFRRGCPGQRLRTDLALVESQAEIITSDAVLKRVVDTMHLADDPEYAPPITQACCPRSRASSIPRRQRPMRRRLRSILSQTRSR